jgi:parvulin-like peptidyl-prolyl isomerase
MSAPKDKKKNPSGSGDRASKVSKRALEEEKKRRKSKRNYAIMGTLIALFIIFVIVMNSSLLYAVLPAVKVGGESFTSAEYDFFYLSDFNQFYSNASSYFSSLIDTSKSLNEQQSMLSEDKTWADYFQDSVLSNLKTLTAQYEAAVAAGAVLSDEDRQNIDDYIGNYKSYAESNNLSLNKFLAANYGRGATEKSVRRLLEMSYIGSAYAQSIYDSGSYTDEELESYYQEHADSYDEIDYLTVYLSGTPVGQDTNGDGQNEEATDEEKAAAMEQAKETAEKIAAAKSVEEFKSLALEKTLSDASESTDKVSSLNAAYSEWLSDKSRTEGDTTSAAVDTGYYAVCYISRNDNHYNTANVRHILVKPVDEDADGTISDEEKAAAEEKINGIYDEWKSGEATEDSFAALANEKSEDPGSNTNGGLYENIYKGQMVGAFNDFCFAPHSAGDTGIVYSESTGYHLIYYVGQGMLYSNILAEGAKRTDTQTAWQDELLAKYETKTTFVLKFANKEAMSLIDNILANIRSSAASSGT